MAEAPLSPDSFAEIANVSRETLARLRIYADMLVKWQKTINLVGRDTLPDLWRRHMLDSAHLAPLILPRRPDGTPVTVLDLGSGAGFPGLVLAILAGEREAGIGKTIAGEAGRAWDMHLVESDTRKCAFLATVARETATAVRIHNRRIEALEPFVADVITARALAPLDALLAYAEPFLGPASECLFLKGATAEDELTTAGKSWKMAIERQASCSGPAGTLLRIKAISRVRSTS